MFVFLYVFLYVFNVPGFSHGFSPGQSKDPQSPTGLCTEHPDVDDLPVIYVSNKWVLIEDR